MEERKLRMFLVENNFVVIRNEDNIEITIEKKELKKYWPELDISDEIYIDYEPERGIFIDFNDENLSLENTPIEEYEEIINNIHVLYKRINDPLYGLTLEEAKEFMKKSIKNMISERIYEKWPLWKQLNYEAGIYDDLTKKEEKDKDIKEMIKYSDIIEELIDNVKDMETLKNYIPEIPILKKEEIKIKKEIVTGKET